MSHVHIVLARNRDISNAIPTLFWPSQRPGPSDFTLRSHPDVIAEARRVNNEEDEDAFYIQRVHKDLLPFASVKVLSPCMGRGFNERLEIDIPVYVQSRVDNPDLSDKEVGATLRRVLGTATDTKE
jgi:hypothetical protein